MPLDLRVPSFGRLSVGVWLVELFAGVLPPLSSMEEDVLELAIDGESSGDGLLVLGSVEVVCDKAGTVVEVGEDIVL